MNKRELAFLGRLFEAEIAAGLGERWTEVVKSKASKLVSKLEADGLIQPAQVMAGSGPFAVKVDGYVLTHAGRFAYCANCEDAPEGEP